jgi:NAD(P)-dependent dehydrogenase (short-subunit alcohol dehydrogenase family)
LHLFDYPFIFHLIVFKKQEPMSLQKKIAIITGSTGGLGPVVAQRFYEEGCKLLLTYLDEDSLSELPETLISDTNNVIALKADVTREEEVVRIFNTAVENFSDVSILLNIVGGYMDQKPFADLSTKEWNTMMDRNLTSTFFTCREAIKRMKDKDYGRIINISAQPGLYPEAGRGAYGIAKAGVAFLSRMLGMELKQTGITVNAIAPSIIKTPANESWGKPEDMKHWVTPEQLADIMVYLCRESSKSINGTVIEAFGGV